MTNIVVFVIIAGRCESVPMLRIIDNIRKEWIATACKNCNSGRVLVKQNTICVPFSAIKCGYSNLVFSLDW